MIRYLILYLGTALAFFAVDMLWLGVIARDLYRQHLSHLLAPDVRWGAAVLFYLIFLLGIVVFAVAPALQSESWLRAVSLGALLGVVAYAAFDLTCLALFRDFPARIAAVDLVWGGVLSAFSATVGYAVGRAIGV